jgi:uncharacterized protein
MQIAQNNGADVTVVTLFAYLHDSCRLNDGSDYEHGPRAAELIMTMQGKIFTITQEQLDLLTEACRGHTSGGCSNNPTIGACWDADRLDLGRAGKIPAAKRMSTTLGKEMAPDQR